VIKKLKLSIPLMALILVSCAVSSQTSSQPSSYNTFTVIFDSRGGSNVPNQIVEPNSFISPPNVSKEGHTLEGWYTSINGGVMLENKWNFFSDRVNVNFQLYASWTVNQYTITFETNGGTFIQPQTNNYNASLSVPNATRVGYGFAAWFMDVGLTQAFTFTTMPASNLTLYAKWTINQYTITFETNGGSSIANITGNYGDSIIKPDDPTREGYTFAGWYSDEALINAYSFTTMPSQATTLYAKWEMIPTLSIISELIFRSNSSLDLAIAIDNSQFAFTLNSNDTYSLSITVQFYVVYIIPEFYTVNLGNLLYNLNGSFGLVSSGNVGTFTINHQSYFQRTFTFGNLSLDNYTFSVT
jgi:uncharacterized repeat protein (TIGR02543 family)